MTAFLIIILSILILLAYIFDITSDKTKIPSVILLLLSGWLIRQGIEASKLNIPDLNPVLPVIGTIGLILIVLEGSLELEFSKNKIKIIKSSFLTAFIPMIVLGIVLTMLFLSKGEKLQPSIANVIPLCVISSAVAISTARHLSSYINEFIVYESSFSDILGIILFNLFVLSGGLSVTVAMIFFLQLLAIAAISFVTTGLLSLLLSKVKHKVKYVPIIFILILIYEISKIYNLPALIFIMVFGLFLGNLDEFTKFKIIKSLKPENLDMEVHKFKEMVIEATFVAKVLFFVLFGFLMKTSDIINLESLLLSLIIVLLIYTVRYIYLKISKTAIFPYFFIAPRGLITILLFISIPSSLSIPMVNNAIIIKIIVITSLIMMLGTMFGEKNENDVNLPGCK
ncbi:MAG: cation:proton antiporter [Ignavibacteria bacterium]|nr:cation:proton antiporter [Ignavibacteria bacterium]